MKNVIKNTLVAGLVLVLSFPVLAQFYVGGNVGQADFEDMDDNPMSFELISGYQFNDYFALQISYLDLGEAEETGSFEDIDFGFGLAVDGINFTAVGAIPISETVSLYGKLGYFMWDATGTIRLDDFSTSGSTDGNDISYGLGVKWAVAENLFVNLGFDRYEIEVSSEDSEEGDSESDFTIDNINLGLTYRF